MKKIFLDANVVLDIIEKDAQRHYTSSFLYDCLLQENFQLLCSPTTVAITFYYLSKFYKHPKKVKEITNEVFKHFTFTTENNTIVRKAMSSNFNDVEDAIQYYSALDAKANSIITNNFFDFIEPSIEVLTPELFIELHL